MLFKFAFFKHFFLTTDFNHLFNVNYNLISSLFSSSPLQNRSTTSHSQLTLQPMDIATVKPPSGGNSEEVVLLLVVCTNSDSPDDRHIGLFTLAETAFPSISQTGEASFSGTLPSSASSTSIFKTFRVLSNIDLEDHAQLNSSFRGGALNSSIASVNSSLLPQRRHILNILPSTSNGGSGNGSVDDSCYIYNSSRIYRINRKCLFFCWSS